MSIDEPNTYQVDELIYEKGDPATHLYFVQKGSVVLVVSNKRVELADGQVFGEGGMVSGQYKATVRAGPAGCTVLPMDINALKAEIGRSPPLVRLFITNILVKLEIAAQLLEQ